KQPAHPLGAHAGVHLDELRAGGGDEDRVHVVGGRLGHQRFAGARRAGQQNAAQRADAEAGYLVGFPHELQRLQQLTLGDFLAADVVERDDLAAVRRVEDLHDFKLAPEAAAVKQEPEQTGQNSEHGQRHHVDAAGGQQNEEAGGGAGQQFFFHCGRSPFVGSAASGGASGTSSYIYAPSAVSRT